MARLRTYCLRKGTLLYHGTSAKDVFEEGGFAPNAPAWFTTSKAVARRFVDWHKGPCPRILVYRAYNYPEGDDIMLCSTDALEFVERICLQGE